MPNTLYHDKKWLMNRYVDDGLSVNAIARSCEVDYATIYKFLKRFGIPLRKRGGLSGPANPRWKGGRYVSYQGYVLVLSIGHPRATVGNRGYVPEQILIAEAKLGRFLRPGETVHHIDENKQNNSLENLYLFATKAEHDLYHNRHRVGRSHSGETIVASNLL